MSKVGLVIVILNCRKHLPPLFNALAKTLPAEAAVCVVDNGSTDGGAEFAEEALAAMKVESLVIRNAENIGFAAASNRGMEALRERQARDCYIFLNPDTVPHEGWLEPLLAELEKPGVGSVVPVLLLPDGTLNSRGNAIHFLGFGFVTGYGESSATARDADILYGTGAAVAVSARALETMRQLTGRDEAFWSSLFIYCEDSDLGWRMAMMGLRNRIVTASEVEHHSSFIGERRDSKGMFYLERNRWLVLFSNYTIATLLVLSPWLLALELAQCLGWRRLYTGSRWELYRAVWKEICSPEFRLRRNCIQSNRTVGDHAILRQMVSSIRHGAVATRQTDGAIDRVLLRLHKCLLYLVRW